MTKLNIDKTHIEKGLKALSVVNKKYPNFFAHQIPVIIGEYDTLIDQVLKNNLSLHDDPKLYTDQHTADQWNAVLVYVDKVQKMYHGHADSKVLDWLNELTDKLIGLKKMN